MGEDQVLQPNAQDNSDQLDDSEEWQPSSSDDLDIRASSPFDEDDDSSYDDQEDEYHFDVRYCVNCTARLCGTVCDACGHSSDHDQELFDSRTSSSAGASTSQQIALLWDERMALHEEGKANPHPERPDRIRAVMARLLSSGLSSRCTMVPCREATIEELHSVHTSELVAFVQAAASGCVPPGCPGLMTSDTYANAHTFSCARLAAGGAAEVASLVAKGEAAHGAAIVRPPGHHAESGMAMGFCFFNNAAVAAKAAQASGAQRVLILDWDIHHGNGTQHIFEDDPSVMYMSLHRYDGGRFYPGTGAVDEVGVGAGEGYTINIPWDAADMGNGDYISAFTSVLIPIAYEYNPDLIIVSAGFDAAEGDPIGECRVTPECFGHMTALLKAVAPIVVLLEGGYNLKSTAASTEACLRVLLGEQPPCLPGNRYASLFGQKAIHSAIMTQASYWKSMRAFAYSLSYQQSSYLKQKASSTSAPTSSTVVVAPAATVTEGPSAAATSGRASRDESASHSRSVSHRPDRVASTSGKHHRRHLHCRKKQILMAIHRRALKAFWKRHRRVAKQQAASK